MKLLYITHCFPRFHNTFVVQEIIGLSSHFEELHVLSMDRPYDAHVQREVLDHGLISRTTYLDDFAEQSWCYPEFDHLTHRFQGKRTFLASAVEWVNDQQFGHVHAAFGNRPSELSLLIHHQTKIPFGLSSYAYDLFVDFPHGEEILSHCAYMATTSEYNRRYVSQTFPGHNEKIAVIPISLPPDNLGIPLRKLESDPPLFRIVSACRLHPIKGIDLALRALAKIQETFPNIRYDILGDGPDKDHLKTLTEQLKLSDKVQFLGDVDSAEVIKRLTASNLFLLPCRVSSDGDRDGFPTAIAEAMAHGVPVLTTPISGIPEVLTKDESAFFAESDNVASLASTLEKAILRGDIRQEVRRNAWQIAQTIFCRNKNSAELSDLIRSSK